MRLKLSVFTLTILLFFAFTDMPAQYSSWVHNAQSVRPSISCDIVADDSGNVYSLEVIMATNYVSAYNYYGYNSPEMCYAISKYSNSGNVLWRKFLVPNEDQTGSNLSMASVEVLTFSKLLSLRKASIQLIENQILHAWNTKI